MVPWHVLQTDLHGLLIYLFRILKSKAGRKYPLFLESVKVSQTEASESESDGREGNSKG